MNLKTTSPLGSNQMAFNVKHLNDCRVHLLSSVDPCCYTPHSNPFILLMDKHRLRAQGLTQTQTAQPTSVSLHEEEC